MVWAPIHRDIHQPSRFPVGDPYLGIRRRCPGGVEGIPMARTRRRSSPTSGSGGTHGAKSTPGAANAAGPGGTHTLRLVRTDEDRCGNGAPALTRDQSGSRVASDRERECSLLWFAGLTKKEIGAEIFLAESTVNTHLTRLRDKFEGRGLSAHNQALLLVRLLAEGELTLAEVLAAVDRVAADTAHSRAPGSLSGCPRSMEGAGSSVMRECR